MRAFLRRLWRRPQRDTTVYREGWPPGVRPVFPWVEAVRVADPELWSEASGLTPGDYIRQFVARNPTHWITERSRLPGSIFWIPDQEKSV